MKPLPPSVLRKFKQLGPQCAIINQEVTKFSEYQSILDLARQERLWFRGHADFEWTLTPGALRFKRIKRRERALNTFREFRRRLEGEFSPVSAPIEIGWMQRAQHYGLPTRLLDWTERMVVGLYFACQMSDRDGAVFVIDPGALNRQHDLNVDGPINPEDHQKRVNTYAGLDGRLNRKGLPTIAISPVWNNPRIKAQEGVFTLHGSQAFHLDGSVESSLTMLPIRMKFKKNLLRELNNMDVHEMALFPEPASVCKFLRRELKLEG